MIMLLRISCMSLRHNVQMSRYIILAHRIALKMKEKGKRQSAKGRHRDERSYSTASGKKNSSLQ